MELGSLNRKVLLTGAGFSRNWGGYTAAEMWSRIKGDSEVQKNHELQNLLTSESSFELALAKARDGNVTTDATEILEAATLRAFQSLDRQLIGSPRSGPDWINIYDVQKFVFRLFSPPDTRGSIDTGYFFTLNQDLWPERFLFNEYVHHAKAPTLPGVRPKVGQQFFHTSCPQEYADHLVEIDPDEVEPSFTGNRGQFNLVKLHGSYNWRVSGGSPAMVIGDKKATQISNLPLLPHYHKAFTEVLQAGAMRLMIIGYGFGDEHINSVIANAVEESHLKVFVWDTRPDLLDWLRDGALHGDEILKGLITTETRRMIDVFPPDQRVTETYDNIVQSFCGTRDST